jgi:hypothetical protein
MQRVLRKCELGARTGKTSLPGLVARFLIRDKLRRMAEKMSGQKVMERRDFQKRLISADQVDPVRKANLVRANASTLGQIQIHYNFAP